jgi:hypothetical protein
METASGNLAVMSLSNDRFAMVIGDIFAEVGGPNLCYNPAVFFSRTGENDFVGGYPFAAGEEISSAQITEHDDKLYIIYSQNVGTETPSRISMSWVELPDKDKRYIFPRSKDILRSYDTTYVRKKDGGFLTRKQNYRNMLPVKDKDGDRDILIFKNNSAGAIEIEPVDVEEGESLEVTLSMKVSVLQSSGSLSLITIGDIYPVKLVMPSARAGDLYISAPGMYQKISSRDNNKWFMVKIEFDKDGIDLRIDEQEPVRVNSRLVSQRFYLGNNMLRHSTKSNDGSAFCVDINSITSKANRKRTFLDF